MKKAIKLQGLFLGGLLTTVSAVAAILYRESPKQGNDDGSLRAESNSISASPAVLSCVTDLDGNVACTASTNGGITYTTIPPQAESFDEDGLQTIGNTSQTGGVPGDQTSEFE